MGYLTVDATASGWRLCCHASSRRCRDLPLVMEIVEGEATIGEFLMALEPMIGNGGVTTEKVQVIQYGPNGVSAAP